MVVLASDLELDNYIRTAMAQLLGMLYDSLSINTSFILTLLFFTGVDSHSGYLAHHGSSTH